MTGTTARVLIALVAWCAAPTSFGAEPRPEKEATSRPQENDVELECTAVKLKHADAKLMASSLAPLFEDGVNRISWLGYGNVVLLRAPASSVASMRALIEQVDVPPPEVQKPAAAPVEPVQELRIIPLHHADAEDVGRILDNLALVPIGARERGPSKGPQARWSVDERTNVIALLATEEQISRALELVKALDVPFEQPKPKASRGEAKGKKEPSGEQSVPHP